MLEVEKKPKRQGKPIKRVKSEPVNIKVRPEVKQAFYDIADAKGATLTAVFEEMVAEYKQRYITDKGI